MFYTIIAVFLLLYLLFKNNYILGIGVIVILLYLFSYKEGLTNAQKKQKITATGLIQKGAVVKKKLATPPGKKK